MSTWPPEQNPRILAKVWLKQQSLGKPFGIKKKEFESSKEIRSCPEIGSLEFQEFGGASRFFCLLSSRGCFTFLRSDLWVPSLGRGESYNPEAHGSALTLRNWFLLLTFSTWSTHAPVVDKDNLGHGP